MRIKPTKPVYLQYPTIEHFIENPAQLMRYSPASWNKKVLISWMLAWFILAGSGSGCMHSRPPVYQDNKQHNKKKKSDDKIKGVVAPIFAHGEGSGATGCIVVSPPVFLTEEEARNIIFTELRAKGLNIDTNIRISLSIGTGHLDELIKFRSDDTISLKFDYYDKGHNIIIDYVSAHEAGGFEEDNGSSVDVFNPKKVAGFKRGVLSDSTYYNGCMFYDPVVKVDNKDGDWKNAEKITKEKSKKLLLAQVEDFINWLKKEGIIE